MKTLLIGADFTANARYTATYGYRLGTTVPGKGITMTEAVIEPQYLKARIYSH